MADRNSRLTISDSWQRLEQILLREIEQDKSSDPLQPAAVLVGSRLLASRLELGLYPALNSKGLGINLKFLTFPDMARSLALTPPFPESAPEAGDFLKLVLATNLLQDLNPGHYFYQVREASGLIRSIIAEHRDLQDGLIIGEQWDLLKDDLKSGNHSRKLSSLFEIFGQLEQRLKPYGQDGKMFQTATERAGKFSQVFGTNRLFLYGFYDFTAVQRQLVRAVSQSAGIAALMVQPKNNGLLAGYGREVLNFYQRDLGLETEEIFSQSDSTNLSRLKKSLSLDQRVEMKADQSLAVVFAPGIDREALEICREIMRLVQKENLRFDEIGILVRDYAAYGRILRETLELHGIPFYLAPKKPLSDFSSVRALLNLFQIPEREYSRRSLIGFLSGHAVKKGDDGAAPELAGLFDIVTREALIVKGKDEWKGRLDQYLATMKKGLERAKTGKGSSEEDAEKLERKQRLIEKKIQAAEKLREISAGLISELEGLKAQKSFPSLSDLGRKLCDKYLDLGFEGEAGLKEQVVKIFREIAGLDQAGVAADYQTFLTLVQAGVAGAGVDYGKFQQGGVCVTDLMAARGVRFKAVIIPGLCEGSFPLRLSENPLLADDDRRWVNGLCKKAGLPGYLSEKRKLPQEERLLFYLACGQADEFLILTSPWLELESNREKPASYLLTYALERMVPEEVEFNRLSKLAEKNGGWIRWVELSGFAPEQEGLALSADDWEENKIERAQDLKELSHLAGGGTRRAIEIAAERWLKEDFGLFTGFPGRDQKYDSRTFSIISRKISPSLLQDFLRCPFEYFLKRVLEVEALTEPEYLWQFNRLAQGNIIHKVLEGLFRGYKGKGPARTREQFREDLEQAIAGYGEPFLRSEYPAPEKLARLELEQIYFYLLKWWRELLPDPEFKETVTEKNISNAPVKLELGDDRCVYLRGRIDRIDRSQTRACVNDYKVSKRVQQGGISQVQLPIYMLSVCNLFGYRPENVEGRFLVMVPEKLGQVEVIRKSGKNLEQHLGMVRKLVNRIADWIEKGVFVPARDDCGGCEFRLGCFATTAVYRKKKRNQLAGEINTLIEETDFKEETDGK